MKEGEFIRKVGGEEKGPLKCRKPREPKQSSERTVPVDNRYMFRLGLLIKMAL